MLVLSVYEGESVMIADNIVVRVLKVEGNKTRIGVEAPREIPVHREKIYKKIQAEKKINGNY